MELPEEAIERLLDGWPVARLATLRRDGRPHQVPIVFARVERLLWTPIDAKPKGEGELARVRHLRHAPRASLLLDRYDADWTRLWWLRVDADAVIVQPRSLESDPQATAAVDALRRKYPQYATLSVLRDPFTLIRLQPTRIASWCAGPEALASRWHS